MLSLIGLDVFSDTETFHAYNNSNSTVFQKFVDEQFTNSSLLIIKNILKKPYYNKEHLLKIQSTIRRYETIINQNETQTKEFQKYFRLNENHREYINEDIQSTKLSDNETESVKNYDFVFFKMYILKLVGCNENELCLTTNNLYNIVLSPVMTLITPILYILIPYSVLRYRMKVNISPMIYLNLLYNTFKMFRVRTKLGITVFVSYLVSFLIYLHTVYTSFFNSKNSYNACTHYVSKINNFTSYLKKSVELLNHFEPSYKPPNEIHEWIKLQYVYNHETCKYEYNNMNKLRFGKKLAFFSKYALKCFDEFFSFFDRVCAIVSIAMFKKNLNMCYSNFIDSDKIIMNAVDCFHLFIKNPVKNTFSIEGKNMIVTGPNAAGKSTFIKSIVLNVLLSQTIGLACATSFSFTPFYFINSQINIPDSKGVESLFEAEMYRCKYNLDIIKYIGFERKALVVMDELFNSTNIVEGISAGYSILNSLSSFKNVLTILTTHYPYLTKVPSFVKYKMDATIDENDDHNIIYKYKLSKGVSKQYLALNILEKNDFDSELIDFAKEIQKRILV